MIGRAGIPHPALNEGAPWSYGVSAQQIAAVCHRCQALCEIFHSLPMLYNFTSAVIWATWFTSSENYLKLSRQVPCPKTHSWKQQWSWNLAPFCANAGCCLFTCTDTELHRLCANCIVETTRATNSISEKEELLWINSSKCATCCLERLIKVKREEWAERDISWVKAEMLMWQWSYRWRVGRLPGGLELDAIKKVNWKSLIFPVIFGVA